MSKPEPRYALYFVPGADSALYRFGSAVLGYDCYSASDIAFTGGVETFSPAWRDIVRDPRVYGFHATLKPPFRLAAGFTEADLMCALPAFAARHPAVPLGNLVVRNVGSFIALVPEEPRPQLDRFAQACVEEFDRFRAPPTPPERARRMAAGLTARQIENLDRWGYPYVFADFRFHMTLTGSLAQPDRQRALPILQNEFAGIASGGTFSLDRIVVARQGDDTAPFQVIHLAALG
jgi:putative phosphonate metabolism protein